MSAMRRFNQPDHDAEEQAGNVHGAATSVFTVAKWFWVAAVTAMLVFHTVGWSVALTEYKDLRPELTSSFADFRSAINRTQNILPVLERIDWAALETTAEELTSVNARVQNVLGHVDYLVDALDILRQMYPQYFPKTPAPRSQPNNAAATINQS
jgi:hypothetical protein